MIVEPGPAPRLVTRTAPEARSRLGDWTTPSCHLPPMGEISEKLISFDHHHAALPGEHDKSEPTNPATADRRGLGSTSCWGGMSAPMVVHFPAENVVEGITYMGGFLGLSAVENRSVGLISSQEYADSGLWSKLLGGRGSDLLHEVYM